MDFNQATLCSCVGPQNGQPRCPCAMRGVVVKNGRYVVPEQDLGPAPEGAKSGTFSGMIFDGWDKRNG